MISRDATSVTNVLLLIWRPLLGLFLLDLIVTFCYMGLEWHWIAPASMPLPLIGTGLAVFLGLRNNTAYARWWEARILWGSVTNHARSFSRSVNTYFSSCDLKATCDLRDLRYELAMLQIAWVHALRCTLRDQEINRTLERLLEPEDIEALDGHTNIPFAIQTLIGRRLAQAAAAGYLDTMGQHAFNMILNDLSNAQGGLERIRNTPMPRQYALFPKMFVAVYCMMLPFGIVPDLQWATPLVSTVVGFLFLALDAAGSELENPFDRSVHDVPMTTITRNIEINLREAVDCPDTPPPPKALLGILR